MNTRKEFILIVSGPSGVGKSTVVGILRNDPIFYYSVSVTTRSPRPGEKNGVDYWFVSREEFEDMIAKNALLEWAKVHVNYYGTPLKYLEEATRNGKILLMDLDIQGALKVKAMKPWAILVFILPPSWEELKKRLSKRNTESEEELIIRLNNAREEMRMAVHYDYVVVNDTPHSCAERILKIMEVEKMRPFRTDLLDKLLADKL